MTSNNPDWLIKKVEELVRATGAGSGIVTVGEGLSVTDDGVLHTTKHIYTVSPTYGSGGKIHPRHNTCLDKGGRLTTTIEPDNGYKIKDVLVDGISVGPVTEYLFADIEEDHTIEAIFEETPIYGYVLDSSISNPSNCIYFTDASANLSSEGRKSKTYSWVKPTIVSQAKIVYDLDRADLTKKADGTVANLDGSDGDVCASFQLLWFKLTPVIGGHIQVHISETEQPGYITFHKFNGIIRDWIHLGMFEATGTTVNSVYSTTLKPTVNQSLKTFRSQIQAKNTTLSEALYGIETYLTHIMYQILFVHAYASLDSQTVLGNGNTNTSATIAVGKADLLTCSGEYGSTTTSNTHVMALFVVNPFGNVWKFMEGCMWYTNSFSFAIDQADIYDIEEEWEGRPTSWRTIIPGPSGAISAAYVNKFFTKDTHTPFFPSATSGTSSTYACDAFWCDTGARCCVAGGAWAYGADAGLFSLGVDGVPGRLTAYIGARLQALDAM